MKQIQSFDELKIGDSLQTHEDIFKYIGGEIVYNKGTILKVRTLHPNAVEAGTEGGRTAHCFCGLKELHKLRLLQ